MLTGDPTTEHGGGNSGTEGTLAPCEATATPLASLETTSDVVGLSGAELLALANQQSRVTVRWPARDSGPSFGESATQLQLQVRDRGEPAVELRCPDPSRTDYKPRLELPVVVTLRTDDGVLDEHFETVLSAETREAARIETITLEPDAFRGSIGAAVARFYSGGYRSLVFELFFTPQGPYGWVAGPFSPHTTRPCAYTAYAVWPADAECWPEIGGQPTDDREVMRTHLARVNQTFELQWSDGRSTQVTLHAELTDSSTCSADEQVSHRVTLRVTTADGSVDLTLPAILSGGPGAVDPWPAHLHDVEPFSLQLMGSVPLDKAGLAEHLGLSRADVSAAIASVYLSSPSAIDSPALRGGLRIVPIDRSGFAEPLPTVELPGGDSEHCFSATATRAKLSSAEFRL